MRIAFALLAIAVLASAFDVVHFKDGRPPISGVVLSENAEEIVVRTLFKGSKGEIAGTADASFPMADIARIERMGPEERRRAIARSEALGNRVMRLYEGLAKIRVTHGSLQGKPALRTKGKHFELTSTCDEQFVREVTYYLEEMFVAYRQSFKIRDDASVRVPVYLFADREQYNRFQKARFGRVIQNPAFYVPRGNYIAACNLVQKDKAAKIRAEIKAAERGAREYKDKIADAGRQITKQVRKVRKEINKEAAAARGRGVAARRVDEWKKKEYARLKGWERTERAKLKLEKKKADEYIRKNRKIIVRNNRILATENEQMFEMLFHEGFHAFAHNFLWLDGKRCFVPRWLDEGFACYFQESVVEAGYLIHGGVDKAVLATLKDAKTRGKLVSVEKIVAGGARDFLVAANANREHSGIYYAESWAIVHYLLGRVPIERIQDYLLMVNTGVDKKKAFEFLMGKKINQVEAGVLMHLSRMK